MMSNSKKFLTSCACLLATSAYSSSGQNPPKPESAQPNTQVQVRPDTAAASNILDSSEKSPASVAPSAPPRAAVSLATGQADSDRPTLDHRNPRYRVMRDDVLVLTFPLSPEFNQTITIEPDGYVTLLGAGSVYIQEMTVPEVIEALKKAYSKILRDPVIDLDLKDFQKPFFIVLGQVGKPGQYDLRHDTTVLQAIAIAGSFTADAKTQVFLFHRVSSGWVEVKNLSLKNILHGKNVNEDLHLQPGDMIYVPNNFISNFKKYVPYSTGLYFNPSSSVF
jgi:polysaccharide export outer membrane protein